MASSVKYLSDLPDPAKEISKCNEFLSSFRDEFGELKYMNMLVRQSSFVLRVRILCWFCSIQQQVADRSLQVIEIDLSDVLKVIDNRYGTSSLKPSFSRFYVVSSSKTTQSLSEICRRILFVTSDTSKTKWINYFPIARLDVNGLM